MVSLLGGSWYILTDYDCLITVLITMLGHLRGLSVGDKYSDN